MLDPAEVSAVELAAAYHERWEIELVLDELKTHQRGPRMVLRSKSPTPTETRSDKRRSETGFFHPARGMPPNYTGVSLTERYWG